MNVDFHIITYGTDSTHAAFYVNHYASFLESFLKNVLVLVCHVNVPAGASSQKSC